MQLNDTQLAQVDAQIKKLISGDNYYGRKYKELNITGVSSQEEFENLPFSSKDDLRNAYPLGIQAVPDEEVVRIHSSSGTTGKPVIIPYTAKDVDDWATMFARCYATAFRLHRVTVSGPQESVSSSAAKSSARWQSRWDQETPTSSCR